MHHQAHDDADEPRTPISTHVPTRPVGGLAWPPPSPIPAACGDSDEQSLCAVYADFVTARAAVQAVDPTEQTAAEATEIVEDYRDTVEQLRETADGRYRAPVDDLDVGDRRRVANARIRRRRRRLRHVGAARRRRLRGAQDAAQRVEELINPQCNPDQD